MRLTKGDLQVALLLMAMILAISAFALMVVFRLA
jgi:hypothetical protein